MKYVRGIMEKVISSYYNQVKHLTDDKVRANYMLELLTVEKDSILGFQDNNRKYDTLDEALERFYRLKEYRFTKTLLENYILTGNFDLALEKQDIVHRLDSFRRISDTLVRMFPCFSVIDHDHL